MAARARPYVGGLIRSFRGDDVILIFIFISIAPPHHHHHRHILIAVGFYFFFFLVSTSSLVIDVVMTPSFDDPIGPFGNTVRREPVVFVWLLLSNFLTPTIPQL